MGTWNFLGLCLSLCLIKIYLVLVQLIWHQFVPFFSTRLNDSRPCQMHRWMKLNCLRHTLRRRRRLHINWWGFLHEWFYETNNALRLTSSISIIFLVFCPAKTRWCLSPLYPYVRPLVQCLMPMTLTWMPQRRTGCIVWIESEPVSLLTCFHIHHQLTLKFKRQLHIDCQVTSRFEIPLAFNCQS